MFPYTSDTYVKTVMFREHIQHLLIKVQRNVKVTQMTPTITIRTQYFIVSVNNNSTRHGGFMKFKRSGVQYCIHEPHTKSRTNTGQKNCSIKNE
jgi:hypothetical protein